ncbi:MAG: 4Fe-4S binding protein, partial [candidate division WOR-3 bacterium]
LKIKELNEDTEVYILYRDIRTYGFKEKYYTLARKKGVKFVRFNENKKPEAKIENGKLFISVFDEVLGLPLKIQADYLILSTGIVANEDAKEIATLCKFPVTKEGFFLEAHMKLRPVDFATDGLFLAGLAHFPKTLDETIVQAQAASGRAGIVLSRDYIESEPYIAVINEEKCSGCHVCIALCPYNAISFDHEKKVAKIDDALCKGCGVCVGACPSKAIAQKHFRDEQIFEEIKEILMI